ncbi:hypothetical protein [Paracraurococcus ruber]|nr:hypothetical protein [Paracraurococcus ruber]
MRFKTLSLGLLGALALAACDSVQAPSGPPVSGTTAGPGAAPLTQQSRDNMGANSGNASAGQATITGTRSGGGESGGRLGLADAGAGGVQRRLDGTLVGRAGLLQRRQLLPGRGDAPWERGEPRRRLGQLQPLVGRVEIEQRLAGRDLVADRDMDGGDAPGRGRRQVVRQLHHLQPGMGRGRVDRHLAEQEPAQPGRQQQQADGPGDRGAGGGLAGQRPGRLAEGCGQAGLPRREKPARSRERAGRPRAVIGGAASRPGGASRRLARIGANIARRQRPLAGRMRRAAGSGAARRRVRSGAA